MMRNDAGARESLTSRGRKDVIADVVVVIVSVVIVVIIVVVLIVTAAGAAEEVNGSRGRKTSVNRDAAI